MWSLFKKQPKPSVKVNSPATNFEIAMTHTMSSGMRCIWKQSNDIDDISENIEFLLESRAHQVQQRAELIEVVNKQRKILGLVELDDQGQVPDAEDINYALESQE